MIVESATIRLAIDLLYSLKKNGFEVTDIKISFVDVNTKFKTFKDLNSLLTYYEKYKYVNANLKNPFTLDKSLASFGKIANYGNLISPEVKPKNISLNKDMCQVGSFCNIESFKCINNVLNYDLLYNCIDISSNFKIYKGKSFNNQKNIDRYNDMIKYEKRISKFIIVYQQLLNKTHVNWLNNLYVDLCYVDVGYVEHSIDLFKLIIPIVKRKISTGIDLNVLQPRYLKKISIKN